MHTLTPHGLPGASEHIYLSYDITKGALNNFKNTLYM